MLRIRLLTAALAAAVGITAGAMVTAQDALPAPRLKAIDDVELETLVKQLHVERDSGAEYASCLWISNEWLYLMFRDQLERDSDIRFLLDEMREYTIVVAALAEPQGDRRRFLSDRDLADKVFFVDRLGEAHAPIDPDLVKPNTRNTMIRNLRVIPSHTRVEDARYAVFFFPGANADGVQLADAQIAGVHSFIVGNQQAEYRTPLPALLQPKVCETCRRTLQGDYQFCPYDATPLP